MISWSDVYKVALALVPLYVPLLLGFCLVRRWKIFTPEQCESVNSLVAFFAIPFFTFGFTVHTDPFRANYRAIAADIVSKAVIAAIIGGWVLLAGGRKNAVSWSITGFSLSTVTSSLVVGVPMAQAMYGDWGQQLVVQLSVFQAIVWITLLLFALEVRKAALGTTTQIRHAADVPSALVIDDVEASNAAAIGVAPTVGSGRPSIWKLVKVVLYKLGRNPNTYASVGGIIWACIANRLQISLPIIIENSIGIMARCGNGLAMFSMGLFMAQQDKLIPCGLSLTFLGLVLKFILDPIVMTIGSIAVGLHGDVLRVAIIQAAVPQSITSFIFAKEYGLHPDVLSTVVIVGMSL
ncbi:probable auxin efflux carrier component 5a [Setaria italica]|uniref:probable auxin efflux carrier component 5a n=1 Tax=Setaria italica TaxID=4555 RepID=UPI0007199FE8|nr:probable auxin efflux carrier component 5a [Setaria italica]